MKIVNPLNEAYFILNIYIFYTLACYDAVFCIYLPYCTCVSCIQYLNIINKYKYTYSLQENCQYCLCNNSTDRKHPSHTLRISYHGLQLRPYTFDNCNPWRVINSWLLYTVDTDHLVMLMLET